MTIVTRALLRPVLPVLTFLDLLLRGLRSGLFVCAVVAGVVALIDWAVRTRRLNPFGPVARFFRSTVDPWLATIERRIVRAGGMPSSAPWWALVTLVVGGIVLITALEFVRSQLAMAAFAMEAGGGLPGLLVSWTVGLLQLALMVRVVASWFGVGASSPWIRWAYALTEWLLAPIRGMLPSFGPMDLSPLVAYFLLSIVGGFVTRML